MAEFVVYPDLIPRIIEVLVPATDITVQEIVNFCRDWEDDPVNLSYDKLINASGKEDLGGGVVVGITAELQNTQIRFEPRATILTSGVVTSNDPGEHLYATGATFTGDSLYSGCTVFNGSAGAMATLISVVSDTHLFTFSLNGGARQDWQIGDGYAIYPNVACSITGGNLVAVDDVGAAINPVLQSANVQVTRTSSSSATLQELEAIQYASYGGSVHIDTSNGTPGIAYPLGTEETPVSNWADAKLIAVDKGFDAFHIHGDIVVGATDNIDNYILHGGGATFNSAKTTITLVDGCSTSNTHFDNARIEGVQGGEAIYHECVIGEISNTHCEFENCKMVGPVTMYHSTGFEWETNHTTDLHNCRTSLITYILDYNHSPIKQVYSEFSGHMEIRNVTHAEAYIHIAAQGARITLASSCTSGVIDIHGMCDLDDQSNGTDVHQHLVSGEMLQDLHDEAFGKWVMDSAADTLTLYKADGITVLKTFDLTEQVSAPPFYIARTPQ